MPDSTEPASSAASSFNIWEILNNGLNAYGNYQTAKIERDIYRMDLEFKKTLNSKPTTETDIDASLSGAFTETLKDTLTNPSNLILLAVAGGLTYAFFKG